MRGLRPNACAAFVVSMACASASLAQSQTPAPAPAAQQTPTDAAPSERAKRDADKVFHWILIQGDRTRKPNASREDRAGGGAGAAPKAVAATQPTQATQPSRQAARPEGSDASGLAAAPVRKPEAPSTPPGAQATALLETPSASAAPGAMTPALSPASTPLAAVDKPEPASAAPAVAAAKATGETAPKIDDKPDAAADADAPVDLVPLARAEPQFPISTMRTLRKGTVQVKFTVQTDGSVTGIEVLHTTSARLNAAATEAIAQWRFQPIARAVTGAVELGFNLE